MICIEKCWSREYAENEYLAWFDYAPIVRGRGWTPTEALSALIDKATDPDWVDIIGGTAESLARTVATMKPTKAVA